MKSGPPNGDVPLKMKKPAEAGLCSFHSPGKRFADDCHKFSRKN
jgi:hypothetical protein